MGEFIASPERRLKRFVPALGDFLPLITMPMRYGWRELKAAYLNEVYDRNAKWIIGGDPELACEEPNASIDAQRPERSFEHCCISLKLTLFHLYFAENIARPPGVPTAQVKQLYDTHFGRAPVALRDRWRGDMVRIAGIASWDELRREWECGVGRCASLSCLHRYFALLNPGAPPPDRAELGAMLRRAMTNSRLKGYHKPPGGARTGGLNRGRGGRRK